MITLITELAAPFLPYIIGAIALLATFFGYGKIKQRQGAQGNQAKVDAATAKANTEAHERMNNADIGAGATDDERVERLRDFSAKHGSGPAKGKGG